MAACAVSPGADPFPTAEISVDGEELTVWVADEAAERRQGLRGVEALPDRVDGMLFVFSPPAAAAFVMEDTLIPLDLWFFDESGSLVEAVTMTPCPADPCPTYPAPSPVAWALETPAGRYELSPGSVLVASP